MPNATAHRLGAALAIGGISAYVENKNGENTAAPLVHATFAGILGTLPDLLEPASHPNHRKTLHSVAFAGLLSYGLYRLQQWETEDDFQAMVKTLGLIAGGAYLVHLAMDATTPRSLPLI